MSRLETVQRKYTELLADMKRTEREHLKAKKRADQLQKEKDSTRSDLTKMTTAKEKLEKLCREMQKDNKKLKDENRRLGDTESRMREELHERLESMVIDVDDFIALKENPEMSPANVDSDDLFRQKFKSFIDQYELREVQFHALLRTKELEIQFLNARYEQQRRAQEHEATKSRQLTSQVSTFSQTETELRSQLNIYVDKFKQVDRSLSPALESRIDNLFSQVEDTLNNSNDLFLTFRREMEEMSKKTKRLEKENHALTRRHQATSENILQMAEDRQRAARDLDALRRKNENLERLCRGMQAQGRGANLPAPNSGSTAAGSTAPVAGAPRKQQTSANGVAGNSDVALDLLDEVGTSASSSYEYDESGAESGMDDADLEHADDEDGQHPDDVPERDAMLQAATGAADLRSAVAATKAQRLHKARGAAGIAVNGQGGKGRSRHVNGER